MTQYRPKKKSPVNTVIPKAWTTAPWCTERALQVSQWKFIMTKKVRNYNQLFMIKYSKVIMIHKSVIK